MDKMKHRLRYRFDRFMEKGIISRVLLLFVFLLIGTFVIGLFGFLIGAGYSGMNMVWKSLTHILDPGVMGTDDIVVEKPTYAFVMILATAYGMLITSGLIGILSNWVGDYMDGLQRSDSVVPVEGHTVILGFNSNIYTIIQQLVEANSNHTSRFKHMYIVIADNLDHMEMSRMVTDHIKDLKGTEIIYRKGEIYETALYEKCSVKKSKAVIINKYADSDVMKTILALNCYLDEDGPEISDGSEFSLPEHAMVVASINNIYNKTAADFSNYNRCRIISINDAISRIIAHTCRQGGLSYLFTEMFDFEGDELYFEEISEGGRLGDLIGKSFEYALQYFEKAVVFGVCYADCGIVLNPLSEELFREKKLQNGDKLILFCEDDGEWGESGVTDPLVYMQEDERWKDKICDVVPERRKDRKLMVIGTNSRLNRILAEYDKYAEKETEVIVSDDSIDGFLFEEFENIKIIKHSVVQNDFSTVVKLIKQYDDLSHILVLSNESKQNADADTDSIALLMYLRAMANEDEKLGDISIVCEMQVYENQVLAEGIGASDLIVGSRFINLMMCQISENPFLLEVFEELLSETGNEIYAVYANEYIKDVEMDFHELTEIMAKYGFIAIGYIKGTRDADAQMKYNCVFNPDKRQKFRLTEDDRIVLLAEEM